MAPNRIKAAFEAWKLERNARQAAVCEEHALAQAGARVFEGLRPHFEAGALNADFHARCAHLHDLAARVSALDAALERSLANDREDYALASDVMRWMIIGRGLCDRVVLRDALQRARGEQAPAQASLGRIAIDASDEALRGLVPAAIAREVASARSRAAEARARSAELAAPYGGKAVPDWMRVVGTEVSAFTHMLVKVVKQKLVQRPPAIAGFIAGWWVTHAFTDSWLDGQLHALGLGGQSYLAPETKERLAFWLPLIAAAVCTYVGSRIGARIRRHYAAGVEPSASHEIAGAPSAEHPPQM